MDYHNHEMSMATPPPPALPPSSAPPPLQRGRRRNAVTDERPPSPRSPRSPRSPCSPRRLCFPDTSITLKVCRRDGAITKVKANSAQTIFKKMKTLPLSQQNEILRLITQSRIEVDGERQDEFNSTLERYIIERQTS